MSVKAAQKVKLTWKGTPEKDATSVWIYRKQSGEKYQRIKKISVTKNSYVDTGVKPGETYQYMFGFADTEVGESSLFKTEKVTMPYYDPPKVKCSKLKKSGKQYLKVSLLTYQGTNMEIYLSQDGKKYKKVSLKNTKIQYYQGNFLLAYQKSLGTVYCKVRTWKKIKNKKCFSAYSEVCKISL